MAADDAVADGAVDANTEAVQVGDTKATPTTGDDVENDVRKKGIVRGVVSNCIAIVLLYGVTCIHPFVRLPVLVSLGIQLLVFFSHGLPQSSEKYYDLSGSATHFAVVAVSIASCPNGASAQQALFGLLSTLWMVRLGTFLYLRILRDGRDPRFDDMKKVPIRFLGAWSLQACWVVLVQMPVILICSVEDASPAAVYLLNIPLLFVWFGAFFLEAIADVQKYEFRTNPANRHKFITSGLWGLARHPNYFGEISMWATAAAAVSVVGVFTANTTMYFSWLSPAFTIVLLLKVSGVPMVAAAGKRKWGSDPAYQAYIKNTPMLIPWPRAQGPTDGRTGAPLI